jgi:hypothetical protein
VERKERRRNLNLNFKGFLYNVPLEGKILHVHMNLLIMYIGEAIRVAHYFVLIFRALVGCRVYYVNYVYSTGRKSFNINNVVRVREFFRVRVRKL